MSQTLMTAYYDGMTIDQAVKFIELAYSQKVTDRVIKNVKAKIKNLSGKDWN